MSRKRSVIRAVLFDLDGTLYDRDALVSEIAKEQYRVFGEYFRDVKEAQFVDMIAERDDHGYGSKPELYTRLAAEYELGGDTAHQMEEHFWEAYDRSCRPPDDTLVALSALQRQGIKLGVITNGSTMRQAAKLKALGLSSFFDTILISESEGLRKPDRRLFQRALDQCGVVAPEALFVGDHPDVDVAGARAAGLAAVWKRVSYWEMTFNDVVTIDSLTELMPMCLET